MRGWIALALGLSSPAFALQLEVTRPELCALSERVVFAEVTDVETRWTATGTLERHVHVAVSDTVQGPASDGLDLVLPGGSLGEVTVYVEDSPRLLANGEYLLFLGRDQAGRLTVYGGEQGAIRILPEGARSGEPLSQARESVAVCRG